MLLTVFDVRDLAEMVARASAVMPDSDAMDLKTDMFRFIKRARPDTKRADWLALVEKAGWGD